MTFRVLMLALASLLLSPHVAQSTTISVESDGSGDYTSLGAAALASSEGDTILVGPGTYYETVTAMTHGVVILSTHGAAATIVDGGNVHRVFLWDTSLGVVIEGLTFTDCYNSSNGSALAFRYGSTATVRDCVFDDNTYAALSASTGSYMLVERCQFTSNTSPTSGPGLYVSGATADVLDCEFTANLAFDHGGATSVSNYGSATYERCTFRNNVAGGDGGAIRAVFATLTTIDCVFIGNSSYVGSAILGHKSNTTMSNCTFDGNSSDIYEGACLVFQYGSAVLERSIISNETSAGGLHLDLATGSHSCNIYHEVTGVPVINRSLSPDERVADPLYCDPDNGDYTISGLGPAAPANSACGQLIGALPEACATEPPPEVIDAPVITSIADVPNDQGRMVRIKWGRSLKDDAYSPTPVLGYGIYRYEGLLTSQAIAALTAAAETGLLAEGWDYLFTVPAHTDTSYQTVAETTCDSTVVGGMCQSAFFVRAETAEPAVFWDSVADTGYSVDNLPPEAVALLTVVAGTSGGNLLSWPESGAPDVEAYHVYRGAHAGFETSPATRVAAVKQTAWRDPASGGYVYKVTVVDKSGNESPAAVSSTAPVTFALGQNAPNPFNPSTIIPFSVPEGGGHVTLSIYDVGGSLIATLLDEAVAPGLKSVTWNGRDHRGAEVVSGVYFFRLSAPGFTDTRKMLMLK